MLHIDYFVYRQILDQYSLTVLLWTECEAASPRAHLLCGFITTDTDAKIALHFRSRVSQKYDVTFQLLECINFT